jgi:hypothetical protein
MRARRQQGNVWGWFSHFKAWRNVPCVGLPEAVQIARLHVKAKEPDAVIPWPNDISRLNVYGFKVGTYWKILAPWEDEPRGFMIRSSRVILISKRTGDVLYDGPANDEG